MKAIYVCIVLFFEIINHVTILPTYLVNNFTMLSLFPDPTTIEQS